MSYTYRAPADPMSPAEHLNRAAEILAAVERSYTPDHPGTRDEYRFDLLVANAHITIATAQATLHPYTRRSAPVTITSHQEATP